ncbi:unnamed protein product [Nesidiocoris tenuis]|uniref:Uncharacterized protein n=1 Tax=Nesidiocoris tenuis TaxID=355587 RepID=A0A6H5GVU1_9HEMI|nr:unnamed protein product [Nesidiocoris tenuis]
MNSDTKTSISKTRGFGKKLNCFVDDNCLCLCTLGNKLPNPNWKPNPTPNPQKNQTNHFSRQPQNQEPSSFQNRPKPSFSVQKPIQPPRPASTQAVPMSWRTSNPNFHNMEAGQETGNELENPMDNETEDQIEYDQNYAPDQEHFLGDTGLPQEFPDSN